LEYESPAFVKSLECESLAFAGAILECRSLKKRGFFTPKHLEEAWLPHSKASWSAKALLS
jgi:hypothetical protein